MKQDRGIIEISQDVYAKGVDRAMRHQKRSVDANCLSSRGHVVRLDRCQGGDQSRLAKGDARGDCDLAEEIEPAGHPRCKCGVFGGREHCGPEVWSAAGWDGGDDLGHS
jgi:hypothetical protein